MLIAVAGLSLEEESGLVVFAEEDLVPALPAGLDLGAIVGRERLGEGKAG